MFSDSTRGVHQPGRQQNDTETFALEPDSVLHRGNEVSSFGDTIRRHVADAPGACEPEVASRGSEHYDLLASSSAEKREKGGDTVDNAEGVDFVLHRTVSRPISNASSRRVCRDVLR